MTYTITGSKLYSFFTQKSLQGIISTDPNFKYYLPDNIAFTKINEIEDWIIRQAEQIKNERMQILINNNGR